MADLTTLERLRRYLGTDVTETTEDDLLQDMITASSVWFETETGRAFDVRPYTDRRVGNGTSEMYTRNYPPVAVASVTVAGEAIPASAVSLVGERVVLDGHTFTLGAPCVISYTAGYGDVPEDVAQAVTEYAALKFRARGRFGHTYTNVTGEDIIPDQGKSGPSFAAVMSVVNSYRRMSF